MAARNYNQALDRVLVYEGGYVNHPRDPGGPTNKGITQRVYDAYRRRNGQEPQSVRLISMVEVRAIYRAQYWNAVRGDQLPAGVDFVLFDGAVNSGSAQSVKWLQRSLRADGLYDGPIDGDPSLATLAAVRQHRDHDALIADVLARRLGLLKSLKTWPVFNRGWERRVASVRAIGQAWAMGSVGPQPSREVAELHGNAKGYAGDVAMALYSPTEGATTSIGTFSLSAVLQGAQRTIEDYVTLHRYVAYALIAITIASVVVGVGSAIAAFFAARKNKRAQRAIDGELVADLPELDLGAELVPTPAPRKRKSRKRKE